MRDLMGELRQAGREMRGEMTGKGLSGRWKMERNAHKILTAKSKEHKEL